jgi:hypothetical protein
MKIKYVAMLSLSVALALASHDGMAQTGNGLDNPDWQEELVPPPPAFSKDGLIPLEMPPHVSVKVGVDPASITVGADGVVRYVIVMTNATGSTNAVYEGIRCISDEVKTYARYSTSGQWSMLANAAWKAVNDNMPSRHAQAFARQGGCQSRLATSKQEIITALRTGRRPDQSGRSN